MLISMFSRAGDRFIDSTVLPCSEGEESAGPGFVGACLGGAKSI